MNKIIPLLSFVFGTIVFLSPIAFAKHATDISGEEKIYQHCEKKLKSVGASKPEHFELICKQASPYSNIVITRVLELGITNVGQVALIAGSGPTSWTNACLELVGQQEELNRVDALAMLCSAVSQQSYASLRQYIEQLNGARLLNPMALAKEHSPRSLKAFLNKFQEVYKFDYCSQVACE